MIRRRLTPSTPSATNIGLDRTFDRGTDSPHIEGSGTLRRTHRYGENPSLARKTQSSPMSVALGVGGVSFRRSRLLHNPAALKAKTKIQNKMAPGSGPESAKTSNILRKNDSPDPPPGPPGGEGAKNKITNRERGPRTARTRLRYM